jgi:hypothetical protein
VKAISSNKGLLILCFMLGVVEVFASSHHVDAFILAGSW